VHLWRAHADAIMVGIGTARADDPSLTVRLPGLAERSPLRVVLDSTLRLNPASHLVRGARDLPTLVLTGRGAPAHARRMLASSGVELGFVPTDPQGRIDLNAALAVLAERGLTRICSEGGPALADALAAHDLIDACTLITGSVTLGESGGLPALGPNLARRLADGSLSAVESCDFGPDTAVTYERI
jgi:diaminohydroxyphosphoribosylaminopyrimidine deaminase/5-amino-6-(5-phosphoribosylamino)uracil reductase